ncbi:3875_t:CDS:2 [Dentiscutata heterogama]|uniref:3875_t:CDS:1 n=1 Tax=Dentiscutata heterogama TaxID=1316150 RepID=A0ACA9LG88_9GLOM|nr:3875_t:CDS:2 [Dentiscutata heterogama]
MIFEYESQIVECESIGELTFKYKDTGEMTFEDTSKIIYEGVSGASFKSESTVATFEYKDNL